MFKKKPLAVVATMLALGAAEASDLKDLKGPAGPWAKNQVPQVRTTRFPSENLLQLGAHSERALDVLIKASLAVAKLGTAASDIASLLAPRKNVSWTELFGVWQAHMRHYRADPKSAAGEWTVSQSENFRIIHTDRKLAAEVALIAEYSRALSYRLWFGESHVRWSPKCEIVLYPTAQEFAGRTGEMPSARALTRCYVRDGWVASRRIELRADMSDMKLGILPHEIAHAVLAGRFARRSPPVWADEGMAVLAQPEDIQDRYLSDMIEARANGKRFRCEQLLLMDSYPEQVQSFYAHSVGVCRMLVDHHGGRERLINFVRTAAELNDYETALLQVYKIRGFKDLEARLETYIADLQGTGCTSHVAPPSRGIKSLPKPIEGLGPRN